MGIFGTKKGTLPPHPRKEPRYEVPLTADGVAGVFGGCADLNRRTLYLNNDPAAARSRRPARCAPAPR